MSELVNGRELIYNTILNCGMTQFRNRDIVQATGIGRQQVADCIAVLMKEGVLAKTGVYYNINDYAAYVRFMLNRNMGKRELHPSKVLSLNPEEFEVLLGALLVVQNVPGADDWRTTGRLVKNELYEEISVAITTLQGYRKMLNTEVNSGPYTNRLARDGKFADRLQKVFVGSAQLFGGIELTGELITEYMRPRLREFFRLDES